MEGRRDPGRGRRDHDDEFISSKAADPPVEDMDKVRMRFSILILPSEELQTRRIKERRRRKRGEGEWGIGDRGEG